MKSKENQRDTRMFPLFVDIRGKSVVAVGGGRIASRRVKTLLNGEFGAVVKVISPEISEEMKIMLSQRGEEELCWIKASYDEKYLEGAHMVLACTSDDGVNRQIYDDCHRLGIMVNNASDKSLCDFHFPGVIIEDDAVIAFNGGGRDHRKVKLLRQRLEEWLSTGREKGNR